LMLYHTHRIVKYQISAQDIDYVILHRYGAGGGFVLPCPGGCGIF
jgi:hypothetical protein